MSLYKLIAFVPVYPNSIKYTAYLLFPVDNRPQYNLLVLGRDCCSAGLQEKGNQVGHNKMYEYCYFEYTILNLAMLSTTQSTAIHYPFLVLHVLLLSVA